MEQKNKNVSAENSLNLINEMINSTRKSILKESGRILIVNGCLITLIASVVFIVCRMTGSPKWNLLWFLMIFSYPLSYFVNSKSENIPDNIISRTLSYSWRFFGIFSIIMALCSIFVPINIGIVIILLFGFSEAITGILVKSIYITVAGFIVGILGAVASIYFNPNLIFIGTGIILVVTGIIIKIKN